MTRKGRCNETTVTSDVNRWRSTWIGVGLAIASAWSTGCSEIFNMDCFEAECSETTADDGSSGTSTFATGAGAGGGSSVCGDSEVTTGEGCDDGNDTPGDGCDAGCAEEPGFACTGAPSDCAPIPPVTAEVGPGLGIALDITQGAPAYTGALDSMRCVTLMVPVKSLTSVVRVEVTLGIAHTWSGDLVVKVASPQGTVTTLMNRPGFAEPGDYAAESGDFGSSADLATDSRIMFGDSEEIVTPAENLGAGLGSDSVVCRDDGVCAFLPSPGAGPGTNLHDFDGESPSGNWHVCVADGDDTELGTLDYAGLSVLAW